MEVAICVITYRRPDGLRRLLEGLGDLSFPNGTPGGVRVVVVDNDPDGSAREVCETFNGNYPWSIDFHVESQRGIPFARNAAVTHALDGADYIAFIDDDEVPEPNWLDELLHVMKTYDAEVVGGPVLPVFVEDPPQWVLDGGFYDRNRHPTGKVLDRAFTGNVLFQRNVFENGVGLFDERMALTGGSDSHFVQRLNQAGHRIVWADDAVAHEWVPPTRVGAKWILQRAYRIGTVNAYIKRDLFGGPKAFMETLSLSAMRFIMGTQMLLVGLVRGRHVRVRGVRQICYGAGLLVGLSGLMYNEYRKIHRV